MEPAIRQPRPRHGDLPFSRPHTHKAPPLPPQHYKGLPQGALSVARSRTGLSSKGYGSATSVADIRSISSEQNSGHQSELKRAPVRERVESETTEPSAGLGSRNRSTRTSVSSATTATSSLPSSLAVLSRPDKPSLALQDSGTSVRSTISRDNTAGEHARQSSLFAHYGTKMRPQKQRQVADETVDHRERVRNPTEQADQSFDSGVQDDAQYWKDKYTESQEVLELSRGRIEIYEEMLRERGL